MAKTDPDRWVYDEWEPLTGFTPNRPASREQMLKARALYAKTYVDGKWRVGVSWAMMVVTLTMAYEVEFGESHSAERTLRSLLEHPDYGRGDPFQFEYPEHWMAAFEIWGGDVEGGMRRMRQLFPIKPRTMALHAVRASLGMVLDSPLPIPDPVPDALVAFTLEFLGMHHGMRRAVAAWNGSRAGLVALLYESHGRRPKPGGDGAIR